MVNRIIFIFLILFFLICTSACAEKSESFAPKEVGGVLLYKKVDFEDGKGGGFKPAGGAKLKLTTDAISGKALKTICPKKDSGPRLDINISGPEDLKMAFMAKNHYFPEARLNVYDKKFKDNTTSYGYRLLDQDQWSPVLYFLDRFHYNADWKVLTKPNAQLSEVRFFSTIYWEDDVNIILDNFVLYRGEDRLPPDKVSGVVAFSTDEGIQLKWNPAKDNVFPMLYVISRARGDGPFFKIAESYLPKYLDNSVEPGKFRYRVLAVDFENNLGPWSEIAECETTTLSKTRNLSQEEADRLNYAEHIREIYKKGKGKVRKNHICMFGDSLTHATVYPQACLAAFNIYSVAARGYPSMTTGWGMNNVFEKALRPQNPEIIMVLFGTNDLNYTRNPSEDYIARSMSNLKAIVKSGEENGVIVVLGTIPPRGFSDPKSKPEAKYNEAVIDLGRELKVPVAYIFRDIQAEGNRAKMIAGDGIHWTIEGMHIAAQAWKKTLEQIEFVIRDRP